MLSGKEKRRKPLAKLPLAPLARHLHGYGAPNHHRNTDFPTIGHAAWNGSSSVWCDVDPQSWYRLGYTSSGRSLVCRLRNWEVACRADCKNDLAVLLRFARRASGGDISTQPYPMVTGCGWLNQGTSRGCHHQDVAVLDRGRLIWRFLAPYGSSGRARVRLENPACKTAQVKCASWMCTLF